MVVHVNSADVMAKLLSLKYEVEGKTGQTIKMAFFGGMEAHILAQEIGSAGVGVIVSPYVPSPPASNRVQRVSTSLHADRDHSP